MGMIQINSKWHDKPETQKGDYGEGLVDKFIENQGFVIYRPVTDGVHGFDRIIYKNEKYYAVEVKTKPICSKYPETGFEVRLYERYKRLSKENNLPVVVFFVDEVSQMIYGNLLSELDKPTQYEGYDYPKKVGHTGGSKFTIYFPMKHMKIYKHLTPEEVNVLKSFGRM